MCRHQVRRKVMIQKIVLELEQVFYHLPKYHMKILLGDFNASGGEKIFANRQLVMIVYIRIVMTIVLE
jgi:hypothetical protein